MNKLMVRGGKVFLIILFVLVLSFNVFAVVDNVACTPVCTATQTCTNGACVDNTQIDPGATGQATAGVFDSTKSTNWLLNATSNRSMTLDIKALADIAIMQKGSGQFSGLVQTLKAKEDNSSNCWPQGGCKVRDTSIATLALSLAGQDVSKEVQWLKDARTAMPNSGKWWIVIKGNNGSCTFNFLGGQKTFTLDEDKIKSGQSFTRGQYYIELNELSNLLTASKLRPEINMSCDPSLGSPITTLIFKPNENTFFIQRSDPGLNLNLNVANACYGAQKGTSCNYMDTAYATWALLEIKAITNDQSLELDNLGTHIYLESQALNKKSDPRALGLLNRILIKSGSAAPSFIADLVNLQRPDGSWGGDAISTSIAMFGLYASDKADAVSKAYVYLSGKTDSVGSWGDDIEATSWALIALHGAELSRVSISSNLNTLPSSAAEICGNNIDDDLNGVKDCADVVCINNAACHCVNNIMDGNELGRDCGGDCSSCLPLGGQNGSVYTPPIDDNRPRTNGTNAGNDTRTAGDGSGSLWWIWVLIILILLGGGFIFYTKYVQTGKIDLGNLFKKKPKGPSFEEFRRQAEFKPIQSSPQRPQNMGARPAMNVSHPREEDELDKSIREAEKLLKG